MIATIGKHPERAGVWCVFVTEPSPCGGHSYYDTDPCYDCQVASEQGPRILSTHATRDGAVVSANQVNREIRTPRDDASTRRSRTPV